MSGAFVIGGGLAGAVAAARLRQRGVDVTLIADRPGATLMHGGGWQIGAAALTRAGLAVEHLDDALALVADGLAPLALRAGPFTLTDDQGARHTVDLAPDSHADAAALPAPVAAVELRGLGHRFDQPRGERVVVDWPRDPAMFGRSYTAVAVQFDAAALDTLTRALEAALAGGHHRGVLLPPVLGLLDDARAALTDALGVPVAETLSTTPSTAGLRLDRAIAAWLARVGARVERGRVTRVDPDRRQIVFTDGQTLDADAIVLATGGRFTGGLASDEGARIAEPLAALPIDRRLPVDPRRATHPTQPTGPLFTTGVRCDVAQRPIRKDGHPAADRIWVAGDLCGGLDPLVDRCGSGRAVLTGYVAATSAADALARS